MQVDQCIVQLKFIVDWMWFFVGGKGEDGFIEQLQQYLVEFIDAVCNVEVIFYYLFDWFVIFIIVIQMLGDVKLVIE